jgi:predicted DCC family thiol-disulfide oxidoreductase YuxK
MQNHQIILFDGVCNFCNFWVNFILNRDKNDIFRFTSLQSAMGQELLKKFSLHTNGFETFLLIDGDDHYIKSTAALKILKHLNSFLKILYPLIFLPKFLRDPFYTIVANYRYNIFGKRDVCRVPTDEEKEKFLE